MAVAPVLWSFWRENTIALLSTKTKYIVAAKAIKKAVWIAHFLEELKISYNVYLSVQLFKDNHKAIGLSKNLENYKRTKHINIHYHYIQKKQENRIITIYFLLIAKMIADSLTKLLHPVKFKKFLSQLGLT